MPAADLLDDYVIATALGLTPTELAALPDYLRVFIRELLAS